MGGAHSVTLVVTDNSGATSTQTRTVTVAPARVGPRIAYDQCWADHGNWQTQCDTHVLVDGSETLLVSWQVGPKWSPDGSKIAFGGGEISVVNLADGSLVYLASHPARDWAQAWSPDGRIAFVSDRDGSVELYVMEADGSNLTRLTYNAGFTGAFRWSPDGGRIAFSSDRDGVRELYVMAADGSNPTRVTHTVGFNEQIAWSFDSGQDCVRLRGGERQPGHLPHQRRWHQLRPADERSGGGLRRRVLAGRRKNRIRNHALRAKCRDRRDGSGWNRQPARLGHAWRATRVVAGRQPARLRGDDPELVFGQMLPAGGSRVRRG